MSRTFCTNHKSIDPTSSQMRRCRKNTDTFCTFYLNCFRLDCSMSPPPPPPLFDWTDLCCCCHGKPSGINSAEERHVSTSWIRNFITFLVCFFIMQMQARRNPSVSIWARFALQPHIFLLIECSPTFSGEFQLNCKRFLETIIMENDS